MYNHLFVLTSASNLPPCTYNDLGVLTSASNLPLSYADIYIINLGIKSHRQNSIAKYK